MSIELPKLLAQDVLDAPITLLGLTRRAANPLIRAGVTTIGQLCAMDEASIRGLEGIGMLAMSQIYASLKALGDVADDAGSVDWPDYYHNQGIEPPPTMLIEDVRAVVRPQKPLQTVPPTVQALPIGALHILKRTFNALLRAEISTVKDLLEAQERGLSRVEGLGAQSIGQLEAILVDLAASVDTAGNVDWPAFWARREITIIPRAYKPGAPPEQIILSLPAIIREILADDGDDRDWKIIERRFGLNSSKRLTLEEIGDAFGLTRERIRQIEHKALIELQSVLIEGQYIEKNYHVHPEVADTIGKLLDTIVTQAREFLLETSFFELIQQALVSDLSKVRTVLILIFRIAGLERIEFDDQDLVPVWEITPTGQADMLKRVVGKLDDLLTTEAGTPMDEIDILGRINRELPKAQKMTAVQLRRFIGLCSTVEQRPDGLFWARFEYIKSRGGQVERLLSEAQQPLHVNEITRLINSRIVPLGMRKVNERTVGNIISDDGRFLPVGRTGQWKLKSWEHVETASVVELMERFFMANNRPATADEILAYISALRPVGESSIGWYLSTNSKLFRKVDKTRWGLASWSETKNAKTWGVEDVCEFVAEYFRKEKVKEVEYAVLRKALAEAAEVSEKTAIGMLRWSPAVTTRRDESERRYAVFQADYAKQLRTGSPMGGRKNPTMEQRMHQRIREILEAKPGFQMPLAELLTIIIKEFNCPDKTVYAYIRRADFAETFTVPGTRTRICRLSRASTLSFPQIQQIADQHLRESIQRAITDLTLDDVDIGLFQLGREFEVVIKKTLGRGNAKNKLTLSQALNKPPTQWKLFEMVDCAKQNGLITDLGVVNLLRQERNNRAHGGRPPLDERQALMNSAQYIAGLYIDYIILFEKHFQSFA